VRGLHWAPAAASGRRPLALKKLLNARIRFTPITGPDRAYYRVEWDTVIGGLLSEEQDALAPRAEDSGRGRHEGRLLRRRGDGDPAHAGLLDGARDEPRRLGVRVL